MYQGWRVRVRVVYACVSKYANLRWRFAWFSLWYLSVLMCVSWNLRVGWHSAACMREAIWVSVFVFRERLTVAEQQMYVVEAIT